MTLADGEAVVLQQGYTPLGAQNAPAAMAGAWCAACPLHVIMGARYGGMPTLTLIFFFTDHYLGTDTRAASAGNVDIVSRTADTVTLRYSLYRPGDGACCPSGGTADVRFRWDGARLTPLDTIPDNRSPAAPP